MMEDTASRDKRKEEKKNQLKGLVRREKTETNNFKEWEL